MLNRHKASCVVASSYRLLIVQARKVLLPFCSASMRGGAVSYSSAALPLLEPAFCSTDRCVAQRVWLAGLSWQVQRYCMLCTCDGQACIAPVLWLVVRLLGVRLKPATLPRGRLNGVLRSNCIHPPSQAFLNQNRIFSFCAACFLFSAEQPDRRASEAKACSWSNELRNNA